MSIVLETRETIYDIVRVHAQATPQAPAFVAEDQEPLTYGALAEQLDRIQRRLNSLGFGRNDRIAILGPNAPEMAALVTGVWNCATAVPMNPALSAGEFSIYLRDLRVHAVAIVAGLDTAAHAVARNIGLPVLDVQRAEPRVAGSIEIHSSFRRTQAARSGRAQMDDLAMVLRTSGTTSRGKIVPATHRQWLAKAIPNARAVKLTREDRCLNPMPLCYGHGLCTALTATLCAGGSLITIPEFSVEAFFHLLETLDPTWYTASYTFHHAIAAAAPNHARAIEKAHLRFIKTASGSLDSQIADELEDMFRAPVIEMYSSTESGPISGNPLPPGIRKRGTAGLLINPDVRIMGPDNRFSSRGQRGEVVVGTAASFTGYEDDPAANTEAFINGWLRMGDEGYLDEDGYLTLTGRIKDMINRGGEKIAPSEVDDALVSHPDVIAAVTFPIPHTRLGEDVGAAVVPAKGAALSDQVLVRYLRSKLAAFKVPRKILIVDEIPKGPTGKIARRSLAEVFGLKGEVPGPRSDQPVDRLPTPLESQLQVLWSEVLGLDSVGLHEDFFVSGGDSLQAVDLFLRIEKEIGRTLPRSILFEAGTVAKMAEQIEKPASAPCLVAIQPKGAHPPFFCVHDGNGEVLNYRHLARHLGEAQPFYGIQCRGLDRKGVPFTRVEDMAAHYIGEIKRVQPEGPYYLGGYSFGGRVAYVMAQQLRAEEEEVALLALLDTASGYGQRRVSFREWLAHQRERISDLAATELPPYLWLRITNFVGMAYMNTRIRCFALAWQYCEKHNKPPPGFMRRPVPANDMIRRSYKARPYDGDAVLFKAELYAWNHADAHDGWRKLIKGNLEVRPIPGRHFEIVDPPHVRALAAELANALECARASHAKNLQVTERAR